MELIIAMAMLTIIFAVVLPQFAVIRNSWDTKQGLSEMLQNGRVLIDHINRNLATASQIVAVSSSSIDFNDCNGVTWRYSVGASNYVQFGQPGSMSDLAGPVSSLVFTCYDACDLTTPITNPEDIRAVKVDSTITNSAISSRSMSFSTLVYLRTNSQSSIGWENEDIGSVAAAGSATMADCNWTVIGSGVDIWDYTDEFHYVYYPLSGDGQIVARVVSMTNTNAWAKAGVMIRETLTGDSKHAMMVVTPGNGTAFQRRTSTGGISTHTAGSAVTAPYWVKIIRRANTFYGYESSDGATWSLVGSETITMATDVYIGLAVTSHNDGALCTANFDNISFLTYEDISTTKASADSNTSVVIPTPVTNTGDLLIASIVTDGSTTISPPSGWTAINQSSYNNEVTLGAWWRFAASSEPASHTFSWSGGEQAYGWMMRFTGCDPTNPINATASSGVTSSNPTSPAVTTTVDGCLILRLGAFDDDNITIGNPGLSGHSAITMDKSATATSPSAPVFVGAGNINSGTSTITPSLPAGIIEGDILLLALETANQAISISNQNGGTWTEVTNSPQGIGTAGSTTATRLTVFWSRYNGTQGAPTTSDSGNHQIGRIVAFRGVIDSGNPWDITAGGVEATSDTSGSIPGATTTVDNTLVVTIIATSLPDATGTTNFSAWTNGNLTGVTECTDNTRNSGNGGGLGIAVGTKATAGAYGNTSVTCATAAVKGMMSIALKPPLPVTGTVSGGAGYLKQSFAGNSGTSTFSLTASNEAQMLTIAIAPDSGKGQVCSEGEIRP